MHGCGIRFEWILRVLCGLHLLLVATNCFIIEPEVFEPLFVIYSIGIICFFTLLIFSFVSYRPWFFVLTLAFQVLYIFLAGYLASLALMGYFTIKLALLRLIFFVNTLVIICDVIAIFLVISMRSEYFSHRKSLARDVEKY
ncbi:unnamed protein product [Caenorhabditis angaria]|uniref:Uncharacterized protein n=1 Tax=Caenorhabditis angaria TaxID=860376 RepID=A0A9P1IIZ9_9PELO|nr:unnamed protein product [Caenorhabditis angaria]